jgi:hypothetical protein
MAGYSGTPLWKKLGYTDGTTAYVEGAFDTYVADLHLPSTVSVRWTKEDSKAMAFVHLFVSSKSTLKTRLQRLRGIIDTAGVIWISWPKKSSGVATDVTEDVVREVALPLGLVDIKVCAVNDTWSGLKLMIRRELR